MSGIIGESKIYYKESRKLWACDLNLGTRPNGKPHRVQITAKTRNELIDKRRKKVREIEDGTFFSGKIPTVSAWWDYWIENIAKKRVNPNTLSNYKSIGRVHIKPNLGKRKLDKLSTTDVRFLHDEMAKRGLSTKIVREGHSLLSLSLKAAVREGVIPFNICDRVDTPKSLSEVRDPFTIDEARKVLVAARGAGVGVHARWLAAFLIGARQAECLALEWDRLDLEAGTADLSWQVQHIPWAHGVDCGCASGSPEVGCPNRRPDIAEGFEMRPCHLGRWFVRPKTASSRRFVPLPRPLWDALAEWKRVAPKNDLGLVWGDVRGNPVRVAEDRREFKELCLSAGVEPRVVHSARHSMVSILLELGVDPEVIRQIAGHSNILATRNYMHVSTGQARKALDLFGDTVS